MVIGIPRTAASRSADRPSEPRGVAFARKHQKPRQQLGRDDLSSIAVDNDYVHIVWADGRAGFLGAWYARIPITSY